MHLITYAIVVAVIVIVWTEDFMSVDRCIQMNRSSRNRDYSTVLITSAESLIRKTICHPTVIQDPISTTTIPTGIERGTLGLRVKNANTRHGGVRKGLCQHNVTVGDVI